MKINKIRVISFFLFFCFSLTDSQASSEIFAQKVDHFNPQNTATFGQRFGIDSEFASGPGSPVILDLCGEAECYTYSPSSIAVMAAKSLHAYIVIVEHRFYGNSFPVQSLSVSNLQFLSSEQALEDLAEIQKFITNREKMTGKWLVTGGSYAGFLATHYRLKHPELVAGAWASSAPVWVGSSSLQDRFIAVQAGSQCLSQIQRANAEIEKRLADPAQKVALKQSFKLSNVVNDLDVLAVIADAYAYATQGGNLSRLCKKIQGIQDVNQLVSTMATIQVAILTGPNGFTPETDSINALMSEAPSNGIRAWMWQVCTEFAWVNLANTDRSLSVSFAGLNQAYFDSVCARGFGLKGIAVSQNDLLCYQSLFTLKWVPVYFTNGGLDPWSVDSILPEQVKQNPALHAYLIPEGAHGSEDSIFMDSFLAAPRQLGVQLFQQWLQ